MKSKYQIQDKDEILYHLPEWVRKLKEYFSGSQDKYAARTDYQPVEKEREEDA